MNSLMTKKCCVAVLLALSLVACNRPGASDALKRDQKSASGGDAAKPAEAPKSGGDAKPAAGAAGAPAGAPPKPPAPVKAANAEQRAMPIEIENIATVESIATVEVKALVSGEITDVLFKEGEAVTEGQELFHIDTRPFEAALKQLEAKRARAVSMQAAANAQVTRDKATAANMHTELERNKQLLQKEFVTQSEYDTARMQAQASAASVDASAAAAASAGDDIRAADADIERAKLDLSYCIIRSPIAGRTGALLIHKGDIVKANDANPMLTIAQMKPIYVSFTLAEKFLPQLRERMQQGPVKVKAKAPTDSHAPAEGTLTFVDNTVDKMTSTIRLKATFPNDDEYLWPGQYVRATIEMNVQQDAVVVPSQAVQNGQKGTYVYVIGPDMKAEMRLVKPGASKDGLLAIDDGLKPGETVVIDGHMRVAPGATVQISTGEEAKPAAPAAAAAPTAEKGAKP